MIAMLLAEVGFVCIGLILYIPGVQGQQKTVCALKGSSVVLPCSAEHPTTNKKWYIVQRNGSGYDMKDVTADRNDKYNISEKNNFTLTINELRDSDAKFYCCSENTEKPQKCWQNAINLQVTDLQVKVIPATEDQRVTLMCSSSCSLTNYIWFSNNNYVYKDSSPWYRELVSSDETVTYSCGIKGYRNLRSPDVSVDSVTSTCFSVTYAKGRMCSYQQKPVNESCSITYPREVHVQKTPAEQGLVRLTCNTSCPLTDHQTAFRWYKNREYQNQQLSLHPSSSPDSFSCAVKDHEDLLSAEVCVADKNCWTVNYVNRRICALQGSSVNISCKYSHPDNQQPKFKFWYKIKRGGKKEAEKLKEAAGRVEFSENMKNHHILTIKQLKKSDSAEYTFRVLTDDAAKNMLDYPGVNLVVTGLEVKFTPSVATEGDKVTLTCSTSCPLTDNTNYIWYLNGRPLTLPENQNKHLVLDPVSSQHEGNYSCSVKIYKNKTSTEKTLTVLSISRYPALVVAGIAAVLLVIIPLTVFYWTRKRTSSESSRAETSENVEQLNPDHVYDEASFHPAEQVDPYSTVQFSKNHTDLYSNIQQHQPQEQEHILYTVVQFRRN